MHGCTPNIGFVALPGLLDGDTEGVISGTEWLSGNGEAEHCSLPRGIDAPHGSFAAAVFGAQFEGPLSGCRVSRGEAYGNLCSGSFPRCDEHGLDQPRALALGDGAQRLGGSDLRRCVQAHGAEQLDAGGVRCAALLTAGSRGVAGEDAHSVGQLSEVRAIAHAVAGRAALIQGPGGSAG